MTEELPKSFVAEAVLKGVDLVEEFFQLFTTGELGTDRQKAMAFFLYTRGLNSNPDTIDD